VISTSRSLLAIGAAALFAPSLVRGEESIPAKIVRDPAPDTPGVESWLATSAYQEGENKIEVLTPTNLAPDKTYPVIYCLPVNAGTHGDWGHPLVEAARERLPDRFGAIFVCPAYHILPWYGDSVTNPLVRQSEYLRRVVIPFIEKTYPAAPGARYLVGFSKSGLGALSLFLRQPGEFAGVAVFENWFGVPNEEQWTKWGFAECYGTRANFDQYDPAPLLKRRATELAAGPARITVIGGGPGARIGVDSLVTLLSDQHIPHFEIRNPALSHRWDSGWLPLAVAALNPEAEPASLRKSSAR
jgi:hypothetical protein